MNNSKFKFCCGLVLVVIALILCALIGSQKIALGLFSGDITSQQIFWELRVPRVLLAFLVGASLSLCGVVLQSLTQNLLASPFTLGVSSGAAFGATLCICLGLDFALGPISGITLCAIAGALLSLSIAVLGAQGCSANVLVLCGVMASYFFSSLSLFLQYLADYARIFEISRWLMGSLSGASYLDGLLIAIILIPCQIYFYRNFLVLDLLSCGTELAIAKGVDFRRTQIMFVFLTSLLVGVLVSVAGPIGFVGILVPHLARLIVGNLHGKLLILAPILGGVFLALCDLFARIVVSPFEIPVGVVTALIGAPVFGILLLQNRKQQYILN